MPLSFDLTIPEYAYMFGFFQADGHLHRQRNDKGKFTLELAKRDEHILYDFQKLISVYSSVIPRTRDTNFKKDYKSCILTVCALSFRESLCSLGLLYGKKSYLIKPPLGSEAYILIEDLNNKLLFTNASPKLALEILLMEF